jgi:hypothetical protein
MKKNTLTLNCKGERLFVTKNLIPTYFMAANERIAGFLFPAGARDVLCSTASRPALGPSQPAFPLEVKQLGCGADHSPLSSAELIRHRDKFVFILFDLYVQHIS